MLDRTFLPGRRSGFPRDLSGTSHNRFVSRTNKRRPRCIRPPPLQIRRQHSTFRMPHRNQRQTPSTQKCGSSVAKGRTASAGLNIGKREALGSFCHVQRYAKGSSPCGVRPFRGLAPFFSEGVDSVLSSSSWSDLGLPIPIPPCRSARSRQTRSLPRLLLVQLRAVRWPRARL